MSTHHTPLYRDTPLILSVSGVTKAFDGFKAIDDLNFYLEEGELRTIIGPNGAGKSTFMDIITGRTRPDVGSVTMHEKDFSWLPMPLVIRQIVEFHGAFN